MWISQIEAEVYILPLDFSVRGDGFECSIGILQEGDGIAFFNRANLIPVNPVKQKHEGEVVGGKISDSEGLVFLNQNDFCVGELKNTQI